MANSRFEYVKSYESQYKALPETYIVIRVDGRGFTKFCEAHGFEKPNDDRALNLINRAAQTVFHPTNFPSGSLTCAYGHSDEYSFIFSKATTIFDRRLDKIMSLVVSAFSSAYIFHWKEHFPNLNLQFPPTFDGRWVQYPSYQSIRDYISWRQADCHVNNQYNYCFWNLVKKEDNPMDDETGLLSEDSKQVPNSNKELLSTTTRQKVQLQLKDTVTADKNEILFSQFGINYNNLSALHRKGTFIYRKRKKSTAISTESIDVIRDDFWRGKDWLLQQSVPEHEKGPATSSKRVKKSEKEGSFKN